MDSRRQYLRITGKHMVRHERFTIPRGGHIREDVTKNISANGILFESTARYDLGAILRLELIVHGINKYKSDFYKSQRLSNTEPFVILGKVVRVEQLTEERFDIGVSLVGLDFGDRSALRKYIDKYLKVL